MRFAATLRDARELMIAAERRAELIGAIEHALELAHAMRGELETTDADYSRIALLEQDLRDARRRAESTNKVRGGR